MHLSLATTLEMIIASIGHVQGKLTDMIYYKACTYEQYKTNLDHDRVSV
jgi:hypothetical protein